MCASGHMALLLADETQRSREGREREHVEKASPSPFPRWSFNLLGLADIDATSGATQTKGPVYVRVCVCATV